MLLLIFYFYVLKEHYMSIFNIGNKSLTYLMESPETRYKVAVLVYNSRDSHKRNQIYSFCSYTKLSQSTLCVRLYHFQRT